MKMRTREVSKTPSNRGGPKSLLLPSTESRIPQRRRRQRQAQGYAPVACAVARAVPGCARTFQRSQCAVEEVGTDWVGSANRLAGGDQ